MRCPAAEIPRPHRLASEPHEERCMTAPDPQDLVRRRYGEVFGAALTPVFSNWRHRGADHAAGAALGYQRAGAAPLFLEAYLDRPIEQVVSEALGRPIERSSVVEIGNFAADNALHMIELWGAAANDLGSDSEIAVATLTAPLRKMFARIGLPVRVLAPARLEALAGDGRDWGSYYDSDPQVCMGVIAHGQQAIAQFLARRSRAAAA
jgi:hypothetical protein